LNGVSKLTPIDSFTSLGIYSSLPDEYPGKKEQIRSLHHFLKIPPRRVVLKKQDII
jgi:hypothetical protein